MSASNCIGAKAAAGKVAKALGKAAQTRIKEIRDALVAGGEPPSSASRMAEAQYGVELKHETARKKWVLVNNVRVRRDLTAAVQKADPKKMGRMAVKMVDDTDFAARSIHKTAMKTLNDWLQRKHPNLLGQLRKPAEWNDTLSVLHGGKGSPEAKALAGAIDEANEWLRKKLNSYGYSIGKLKDWGIPHSHNAMSINSIGKGAWTKQVDAQLDWAGMINPRTGMEFGAVPPQAFRDDYLGAVFDNIVYGRNSKNPQWGKSSAGGALERHRMLKFKDAKAWTDYNAKFGSADPHSALLQHFDTMSRHIALARTFGPDAETAMGYLTDLIAKRARDEQIGGTGAKWAEGGAKLALGMLRVHEGGVGPNGKLGALSAHFFSTTRKVLTAALLDRAVVISVPSDLNSARIAAQAIGDNPANMLTTYVNLLKDDVAGGGTTQADLLAQQWILESWANPGVTSARFQAEYPAAAFAEKLSNASMRIQGLTSHTDNLRAAVGHSAGALFHANKDVPFADLNFGLRKLMEDSGVTPADWDVFRAGTPHVAPNGAQFLSPLLWHKMGGDDDLFLKMQGVVERYMELAVPTRSLVAQGIMNPVAYGLAPGSPGYEVMKSIGMFKSFPAAFIVNQTRMLNMKPQWGGMDGKAAYLAQLFATTTLVGAFGIQIGELLMGRDPQDMTNPGFVVRSILRGGALGPVGDILTAGTTSWGGGLAGYLAGPMAQVGSDALGMTFGNLATAASQALNGDDIDVGLFADLIKFQKRYTPMWQTPVAAGGLAFERLLSDQLLNILDPEAVDDLVEAGTRRDNLNGTRSNWLPGQALPTSLPNLGNAFGN